MNDYLFFILNIVLFALPLALIEINIEKDHGWGGGLPKDKWYAKSSLKGTWADKVITMITGFESPLNYHVIIMIIFFSVFICELIFSGKNILLIVACFLGTNMFADFFWFSFNWHFHSFKELLKGPNGSIHWHKHWLKIGKETYLPKTYPLWFAATIIFLVLSQVLY